MTCLGIHDPTYDETDPSCLVAVISQLVHYDTFTSHFLAHGFLASYKHLSCLSFQLSSYAIVIHLLESISRVVVPLAYID